jgi:Fe2+ transport system protein FeoA
VVIRQLKASPEINQRLREMGFSEERQIKLISLQTNILCQVCNARLGLNQRLAECIWVEAVHQRAVA